MMCLPKDVNDSSAMNCAVPRVHPGWGWGQSWDIEGMAVVGGSRDGAPLALVPHMNLRTKLAEHQALLEPGEPW